MKKYLFGILLASVLVPSAFVSAQASDTLTVTPVVSTIVTQYNSAHPDTPDLKSLHTIKIKPSKNIKLTGVSTSFENSSGVNYSTIKTKRENKLDNVIIPNTGVDLQAGKEYYLSVTTTTDTNELFAGTYRSVLGYIYYSISDDNRYHEANIKTTQQVAIVGEKAPYIKELSPTNSNPFTPGDKVTIIGDRLNGSSVSVVSPQGATIFSTSTFNVGTGKVGFFVPNIIKSGNYNLTVSNKYGGSNKMYFSVGQPKPAITNVFFDGINLGWVTQGTSTKAIWYTSGSLPNVDVLVCYLRTGQSDACFFAYKNIKNTGSVSNVRIGTNIPINSNAYIKIRQAGTDSVMGKSKTFKVVANKILPLVELVSVRTDVSQNEGVNNDTGIFEIKFKVRALGGNIYMSPLVGTSSAAYNLFALDKSGTVVTNGSISSNLATTNSNLSTNGNHVIKDGEERTFVLTVVAELGGGLTSGQYRTTLTAIKWNANDTKTYSSYTDLSGFRTSYTLLSKANSSEQMASIITSLENLINSLKEKLGFAN